jgi:hypothetical protein
MNRCGWILAIGFVSTAALPAAAAGKKAADRYLEYRMAVSRASSLDDLLPFMTHEEAERTHSAPAAVREQAWTALRDPAWRLSGVKVENASESGDKAHLMITGMAPGDATARRGFVNMVREGGEWKVKDELWLGSGAEPRRSSPGVHTSEVEVERAEEPAPAPAARPADLGLEDAKTSAAMSEMRDILSGESAYMSSNGGYYDTLACLARVGGCIPGYGSVTYSWIKPELASLATRGGYKRRFDAGPAVPASEAKAKSASPSSLQAFAYWIIPDPPEPGRRARCVDDHYDDNTQVSGRICEMPDATAPPTKGECPVDHGCRVIE